MNKEWDVVVIGAGLGGLSAAARLARAGQRVLVLEQNARPGGYAYGVQRDGFYFDFSLHSMDGVAPGGWAYLTLRELGVLDRVRFERLDPCYVVRYAGRQVIAHANPVDYETDLISQFPAEANGIRSLFDELFSIYREARRLRVDEARDCPPFAHKLAQHFPHLVRSLRENAAELLARHIAQPELRTVISMQSWTFFGLPPSRLSAMAFSMLWGSGHHYGTFYPCGGSAAVSRTIETIVKEHQGEILYGQMVTRIRVRDGLAVSVQTDSGLEVQARAFISNANAPETFLKLIEPEHVPPGYASRVAVTPDSLSSFNIYLGLDRDLAAEGWPAHGMYIADGDGDADSQHAAIVAGDWERVPYMLVHYTKANPECAPAGDSVLACMCLAPWNYENVWGTNGDVRGYSENAAYRQIKAAVAETLLARAEKHLPGLRSAIRRQEIATPLTNWRYTLNRAGAIFGYEQSTDNMQMCRLPQETPIPNLFLAGAWTTPGGGQSAVLLSGYDAADYVLGYLSGGSRKQTSPGKVASAPAGADAHRPSPNGLNDAPFFTLGQRAPDFELEEVGSRRLITLQSFAGRPLVLILTAQGTVGAVAGINAAVRAKCPLPGQAMVASVIDLRKVPSLARQSVESALGRNYKQVAAGVPDGFDPADYILVLPDWTGQIFSAFNIQDADRAAAVVLIDRAGKVQGTLRGDNHTEQVLDVLRWL